MSLNLNQCTLAGRIATEPELKTTPSQTSVVNFVLAVDRKPAKDGEKKTDFITLVAWDKTAEFISKYFRKGSAICVNGMIQTRKWQDRDGSARYATDVIVREAFFVESKGTAAGSSSPEAQKEPTDMAPLPTDADLPF